MVKDLLEAMAAIEVQAGAIDPEDKAALYDLLVQAYYKAKDVIEKLQTIAPEPVKVIDTDQVDQLKFKLTETQDLADQWRGSAETAQADVERLTQEVSFNEAQRQQGIDAYELLLDEKQAIQSTIKQLEDILIPKA